MHLHLHLPGFQAFVHQMHERALRRRPVVVPVSASATAPLIACSHEAWSCGIRPGMRLPEAMRLAPELVVRLPHAGRASDVQGEIASVLKEFSPLVASTPGRWDMDLRTTEGFWRDRLIQGRVIESGLAQARLIAEQVGQRLQEDLGRSPHIGVGAHVLAARVAAKLAAQQEGSSSVAIIRPEEEQRTIDLFSVHALPIPIPLLDHLVFMNCLRVGEVRQLGVQGLATITTSVGRALHAMLHGHDQRLPASQDGEAHLSAQTGTGVGGADAKAVLPLLHSIAQQVGHLLRSHHVAATRLTLSVKWGMGTTRHVVFTPAYQVCSDRDLKHVAECLLVKAGEEPHPWTWLRLAATGLVEAEDQQDLFRLSSPAWSQPVAVPERELLSEPMPVLGSTLITGG